ncbi:MAG: hypothetical protein WC314_13705 [Vulcanimicrobiota bacterium]
MKINQGKFLYPRFAVQQSALQRDVGAAKLANAQSYGRQTNRSEDLVELHQATSPEVHLTPRALREQSLETRGFRSAGLSRSRLLADLLDKLESGLSNPEAAALYARAEKLSGDSGAEPFLAALVHNAVGEKLAQFRPGMSREQLAQEAEQDPEVKKLMSLSDSARAYLKAVKKNPSETSASDEDPWKKSAEEQIKRLKETHATMLKITEIYASMADERIKTAAQIHQITAEAARAVSEMQQNSFRQSLLSSQKRHLEYLKMLNEG